MTDQQIDLERVHIMEKEIFRPIKGFDGAYEVSNYGRVFSHRNNKCLKLKRNRYGYIQVVLCDDEHNHKTRLVHRLVAEAFVENPDNKKIVDHINTERADNRASNLRW